MKINEKNLCFFATTPPVDLEGWLNKKGEINKSWQRRWFVLKGNLLFYFEKKGDREPLGMIILEGCTIELAEEGEQYCFQIIFHGPNNRTYFLSTESQINMEQWMKALTCAGYDYMKLMVAELQRQLDEIEQGYKEEENRILEATTPAQPPKPPRRQNPFNKTAPTEYASNADGFDKPAKSTSAEAGASSEDSSSSKFYVPPSVTRPAPPLPSATMKTAPDGNPPQFQPPLLGLPVGGLEMLDKDQHTLASSSNSKTSSHSNSTSGGNNPGRDKLLPPVTKSKSSPGGDGLSRTPSGASSKSINLTPTIINPGFGSSSCSSSSTSSSSSHNGNILSVDLLAEATTEEFTFERMHRMLGEPVLSDLQTRKIAMEKSEQPLISL